MKQKIYILLMVKHTGACWENTYQQVLLSDSGTSAGKDLWTTV